MRRYGIRSAISTMLTFWRLNLQTKEAVKEEHLKARKNQLMKENGKSVLFVDRIISEDLELFYTSLQNPERQPKAERARFFLDKKLTEEELTLLENRNREYLNTFLSYRSDRLPANFDDKMKEIKESSDPESIFSYSFGERNTIVLHVTLKSMQEEMRKRVANEDLSDMELKKQRVKWYSRNQFTYKFVKKECN